MTLYFLKLQEKLDKEGKKQKQKKLKLNFQMLTCFSYTFAIVVWCGTIIFLLFYYTNLISLSYTGLKLGLENGIFYLDIIICNCATYNNFYCPIILT